MSILAISGHDIIQYSCLLNNDIYHNLFLNLKMYLDWDCLCLLKNLLIYCRINKIQCLGIRVNTISILEPEEFLDVVALFCNFVLLIYSCNFSVVCNTNMLFNSNETNRTSGANQAACTEEI